MGDEVQAIKAGLLEVADLVVVNKGDKPGAQRTAAQLRAMLVASAPRGGDDSAAATQAPGGADHDRRDRRRACRSCWRRWTSIGPSGGWGSRRRRASRVPRPRSGRSSPTGCASDCTTRRTRPPTEATLEDVAEHRLDPYAAADRFLEE